MKIFCVVLAVFLIFNLGVVAYADDPSDAVHDDGSSGGDISDQDVDPATNTDLEVPEGVKAYVEDDQKVIFLEHGTVVIQDELEDYQSVRSEPSRSSTPVGYYVNVSSSIGSVLYIPSEYSEDSLYVDSGGYLYGCRSSSWQGFIGNYIVRFPAYSDPQYRLNDSPGYTWTDFDIEYVSSPNVEIMGANMLPTSSNGSMYMLFAFLGVIILAVFMKR